MFFTDYILDELKRLRNRINQLELELQRELENPTLPQVPLAERKILIGDSDGLARPGDISEFTLNDLGAPDTSLQLNGQRIANVGAPVLSGDVVRLADLQASELSAKARFVHQQNSLAQDWFIVHNLGFPPEVIIFSDGVYSKAHVSHGPGFLTSTVILGSPSSGTAYCIS
jgi:hypothetical protein